MIMILNNPNCKINSNWGGGGGMTPPPPPPAQNPQSNRAATMLLFLHKKWSIIITGYFLY